MDIKISIVDIMQIQPRYLKRLCFLSFVNEKFNKNAKVEKLTEKLGRGVRLTVIGPLHAIPLGKRKTALDWHSDRSQFHHFIGLTLRNKAAAETSKNEISSVWKNY